jgi:hypothetical protein
MVCSGVDLRRCLTGSTIRRYVSDTGSLGLFPPSRFLAFFGVSAEFLDNMAVIFLEVAYQ